MALGSKNFRMEIDMKGIIKMERFKVMDNTIG
jgi:hypothetical protein